MTGIFDRLYKTNTGDIAIFGDHWRGPDTLTRDWTLVARYEAPENSDGLTAEVDCAAMPARFYRLRVLQGPNSCGEQQDGFCLSTGSGAEVGRWTALTAKLVSEGMVGLSRESS